MPGLPALSGPFRAPAAGGAPRQLVVLLHGLGADGNDLIDLAPEFGRVLPHAAFVSPNAPEPFDMAPFGFQWFSLSDTGPAALLAGARKAAPVLNAFLDDILAQAGLDDGRMALLGFSQGCMMALHVGLRRAGAPAGILGYSGMLVGEEALAAEIRHRPPVRLVHGEADEIVPVAALAAAGAALKGVQVPVETFVRPGLPHGIDGEAVRLGQEFLSRLFPT